MADAVVETDAGVASGAVRLQAPATSAIAAIQDIDATLFMKASQAPAP
ncbi:hypothetical protein LF41_594 [Lysobacter dokdonensis DS-58]|uniref:Uncharacterized protein n=1 Tax=Lysobacter dokdonensis DS-58 TaxID=1300345 RepID=A0A0A2WFP2_9GAMM|nr:hypothetical protein LF41_594 [Lysobacter dokdonensis DS-58]